jgi:hypothetical protein
MKAMILKSFGGPESFELCDVPKPVPQTGQVLVRVHAPSIHWITRFDVAIIPTWCNCRPLPDTTYLALSKKLGQV